MNGEIPKYFCEGVKFPLHKKVMLVKLKSTEASLYEDIKIYCMLAFCLKDLQFCINNSILKDF